MSGDSQALATVAALAELDPRFASRLSPMGDCLIWCGAMTKAGYGNLTRGQRNYRAHRWAFELLRGPIPAGLQLDHLCRHRPCVNPDHLEPVSNWENTLRGANNIARHARKDSCDRGHLFDAQNTYRWRGGRYCRACRAEAKRRQRSGVAA